MSTLYPLPDAPAETLKDFPPLRPPLTHARLKTASSLPLKPFINVPLLLVACAFGGFLHSIVVMLLVHDFSFVLIFLILARSYKSFGSPMKNIDSCSHL